MRKGTTLFLMFLMALVTLQPAAYAAAGYNDSYAVEKQEVSASDSSSSQGRQSPYFQNVVLYSLGQILAGVGAGLKWLVDQITTFVMNILYKPLVEPFLKDMTQEKIEIKDQISKDKVEALTAGRGGISNNKMAHEAALATGEMQALSTVYGMEKMDNKNAYDVENQGSTLDYIYSGQASTHCKAPTARRNFSGARGSYMQRTVDISRGLGRDRDKQGPLGEINRRSCSAIAFGALNNIDEDLRNTMQANCAREYPDIVFNDCTEGKDTDYTNSIDAVRSTVDTNSVVRDEDAPTKYRSCGVETAEAKKQTQVAVIENIYNGDSVTPVEPAAVEGAYDKRTGSMEGNVKEHLLDVRSLKAQRSVSINTFAHILGRKAEFKNEGEQKTLFDDLERMFVDTADQAKFKDTPYGVMFEQYTKDPSYEAQLEVLAKILYLHPGYIASVSPTDKGSDKGGLDKSELLMATATESIVMHDTLQSALRQEALLATFLETMLAKKRVKVEQSANTLQ